jgi:hypothetical protein
MTITPVEKKGLSPQTQKWLGISLLLACLLVGSGIIWFFMFAASPRQRSVTVDPKQQSIGVQGRLPTDRSARQMPGVHRLDGSTWLVNGSSGSLRVVKQKQGYQFNFGFAQGIVAPEQVALFSALIRAQNDQAMAKEWGISTEQVAKLKNLNLRQALLKPSNEDRAAMTALWNGYLAAGDGQARADAQKQLIAKLDAIAKAETEAARKSMATRLDGAKQVLSAEQLQKLIQR